ncbi:Gfo/Idh/MocA family protein [Nocardioides mesophilus]|uniref:Gfo/Idh/MocA family oxidoreductase n=1 Tax=Nocardioides mesophilus TaxID=433659 RepID=A0A7G9RDT4_9ACTN|nr:Gfo/Idh/MocA family oxidoreductase [Nocardioides mesophilus]QNN53759.1 Gfo/Idh/MocA family oxidoreductase [Nocardioides mesophilus]
MNDEATSVVRVGVVGAGAMGAAHVQTLTRWVGGARVSAVHDADPERTAQVAQLAGARAAASAEQLVGADDVDAVLVAAPDPLHEELVLACLAGGLPVLCEKPLATGTEGSRRVVDAELAGGRRLVQVGFMRRFDPAYVELRALVRSGALGDVRAAHCVHRNAQAHPDATSEGVLVNSMIHELDVVPWLLDDPLAAVTVHAARVPAGALRDVQVAVLETVAGAVVTVEVSVNARYGYDIHTEVVGTAGTASLTPPYGLGVRRAGLSGRVVGGDFVARFADAYREELAAWVQGIREDRPVGPSAWDGHRANLAASAAVESLHGAGRVEVPHEPTPPLYA